TDLENIVLYWRYIPYGVLDLSGQRMNRPDAATADPAGPLGDLLVDVGSGEHRSVAAVELGFVQATLDASLAVTQLFAYPSFHLKSLRVFEVSWYSQLMKPRQTPRDFRFFQNSAPGGPGNLACSRFSSDSDSPAIEVGEGNVHFWPVWTGRIGYPKHLLEHSGFHHWMDRRILA